MNPRLMFDERKVNENLNTLGQLTKKAGCSMMIVTKSFCAQKDLVDIIAAHKDVDYLADSRIQNLINYGDVEKPKVLLRLPQQSETYLVVKHADISFNSELATIKKLNEEAAKQSLVHKIVLMIDLGDLREGLFFREKEEIFNTVGEILKQRNIELCGLGTNLTCYGAIIPKYDNLSVLTNLAAELRTEFKIDLPMVSGGNSSSLYLIEKGGLPEGINNLRLGEAFVLGNETAYGERIPGTHHDLFILEAEIIELKTKPSLPIGEVGMDAFGNVPSYEDRGDIKRAILAIGQQDANIEGMTPIDGDIDILGASSDHLIMDVSRSKTDYKVGGTIGFTLNYGGLLKAATSSYVSKGRR